MDTVEEELSRDPVIQELRVQRITLLSLLGKHEYVEILQEQ